MFSGMLMPPHVVAATGRSMCEFESLQLKSECLPLLLLDVLVLGERDFVCHSPAGNQDIMLILATGVLGLSRLRG